MAYIGKEPIVGNFQVCDAISVVNGQAAYTMQVSSTNVVPESVNHMLVSLNGILQKPGSSFTISGSTITFASNLATGDVIDFVMLLGNVLDIGTPSDATVTNAKTNFTSTSSAAGLQIKGDGTTDGTLQLNCSQNTHGIKIASPAHSAGQSYKLIFPSGNVTAGKFLKVDSVSGSGTTGIGTMTFADAGGTHAKLITTTLGSDASSIDFDSTYITSTYNNYLIVFNLLSASDGAVAQMRFSNSGTFRTGSSEYGQAFYGDGGTDNNSNNNPHIEFTGGVGNATGENGSGIIYVQNITSTHYTQMNFISSNSTTAGAHGFRVGGGMSNTRQADDGIRIFFDTGNIKSGSVVTLYGITQ
jgi:hypothetical protein